ncbi:helix-turn-helix transcriptional regulator [Bradyrhizobium cenepequi]
MSNEDEIGISATAAEGCGAPASGNVPGDSPWQIAETALQLRKAIGLLTEVEVAAVLKLNSIGTLATWRSQASGPPSVKLGKRVFYTQAGLANWINQKIAEQDNERLLAQPKAAA